MNSQEKRVQKLEEMKNPKQVKVIISFMGDGELPEPPPISNGVKVEYVRIAWENKHDMSDEIINNEERTDD